MKNWYGRPITLADVPGDVRVCADGDFIGPFARGYFMSAADAFREHLRARNHVRHGQLNSGFTGLADALTRQSTGYQQRIFIAKSGNSGTIGSSVSVWRFGTSPAGGSTPGGAPAGRACDRTTAGAFGQTNPSSGTLHFLSADMTSTQQQTLLLYDRLFDCAKTANSTTAESVTGVPTRYQSTTASSASYAGDNFLFAEVGAGGLGATAHSWDTCTYTNQAGAGATLPATAGFANANADRTDHAAWFMPLAAGDVGIQTLTQMQCNASNGGSLNFVIGHPIAFMSFPQINTMIPFDWLTTRQMLPRVLDDACLTFMEPNRANGTATTYVGYVALLNAP